MVLCRLPKFANNISLQPINYEVILNMTVSFYIDFHENNYQKHCHNSSMLRNFIGQRSYSYYKAHTHIVFSNE